MEFGKPKMTFIIETLRRNDMNATAIHNILITAWSDDAPNLRRVQQIVQELRDGFRQSFERVPGSGRQVSDTRTNNIPLKLQQCSIFLRVWRIVF